MKYCRFSLEKQIHLLCSGSVDVAKINIVPSIFTALNHYTFRTHQCLRIGEVVRAEMFFNYFFCGITLIFFGRTTDRRHYIRSNVG